MSETLVVVPTLALVGSTASASGSGYVPKARHRVLYGSSVKATFRTTRNGSFGPIGVLLSPTAATAAVSVQQYVGGKWAPVGPPISVTTVAAEPEPTPAPTGRTLPAPKAGWNPIVTELFDKPCAEGSFAATYPLFVPYTKGWHDTSKRGRYNPDIASVADGVLTIRIRTENGYPQVFTMTAHPAGWSARGGASRWRAETLIRADRIPGIKTATMGWTDARHEDYPYNGVDMGPDYVKWLFGEIDYLEGDFDGSTMDAYVHFSDVQHTANTTTKVVTPTEPFQESVDLGVNLDNWHHIACEYVDGQYVEVAIDGVMKRRFVNRPPKGPFHLNWQNETNLHGWPIDPAGGRVQIAAIRISVPA